MTGSLTVVDTGLLPARWNVAMSAAMVELHQAGDIPDTLRFYRLPRSVLLGRHQNSREVRLRYCQKQKIEIARRRLEGATVYMNPGILAWETVISHRNFVLQERLLAKENQHRRAYRRSGGRKSEKAGSEVVRRD
ncbi:MAG TPA: hypothetical protein VMI47_11040 [Pseudolabrys sp.]|nr:hypothetical protein [Pseudolabrys sp.]